MTIKAATYSRFSSSNQREESIDAQQRAIYKYMAEKGYAPAGDYTDEALTGTNTDRPGFLGSPLFDRGQLFQSNFQRYIIYWDEEKS